MKADFKKWLEENNMYKKYTVSASWVINQFAQDYAKKELEIFKNSILHEAELRNIDALVQACINSVNK
jgi:hypothetical protein